MSTRESRRLKEKRSIIPFGDIMLPVIGLAAVGLLIVGVKLFFLSGPKIPEYKPMVYANAQPKNQEEVSPVMPSVQVAEVSPPTSPGGNKTVLAAPVGSKSAGGSPPVKVATAKPSPVAAPPPPKKVAAPPQPAAKPLPPPANSKWGVQIGSFGTKKGAETVQQQAAKAGYRAAVTSAVVNGKTYYRVTVPAGNDRNSANSLAKTLEKAGFPVFVLEIR